MKKLVLIFACCLVLTGCSRNNEKFGSSSESLSSPESTYIISENSAGSSSGEVMSGSSIVVESSSSSAVESSFSSAVESSSSSAVKSSSSSVVKSSSSSVVESSSSSAVKSSSSSVVKSSSSSVVKSSSSSAVESSSSSKIQSSSSSTPAPEIIGNYGRRAPEAWEVEFSNEVFELVNAERVKNGLPEFKKMDALTETATVRAWECMVNYGHTRPDGARFNTALTEQGIRFRACAENIAAGQQTPQDVVNAWLNSTGHRANILSDQYEFLGVGFYYDKNNAGGYRYFWAQNFCSLL